MTGVTRQDRIRGRAAVRADWRCDAYSRFVAALVLAFAGAMVGACSGTSQSMAHSGPSTSADHAAALALHNPGVSAAAGTSGSTTATMPLITRFLRPRQRAIWIGDSLAARGFGPGGDVSTAAGGGFVVQGGASGAIATITTTAPHGLIPGNYVQIYNVGDPGYSDALNGAVVPVLTVPSSTQFTVSAQYGGATMPAGDYSAGYAGNNWAVKSMSQWLDESWLTWLNVYMKGYFTVVANYAQGGTGSQVGVALIPKILAGPKAEYAFIQYCTNDLNSATPAVDACDANVRAIVTAVLGAGMVPVVCLPMAIGDPGATPSDPASLVKADALQAVRASLLQLGADDPRVLVLDTYAASVNANDPLFRFKPNYAPVDGIHPSSFGAASIAQAIAIDLVRFLPPPDALPTSLTDDQTIDPNAANIVQNGLMAGAAGTVGSSTYNQFSGSAPTGWGIGGNGGTAVTPLSIAVSGNNAHPGFAGYTMDLAIATAGPLQQIQIGTNGAGGSSFGGRMSAGEWYRCGFQVFSPQSALPVNFSGQVFLNFGGGNAPSVYFMASQGALWENGTPFTPGQSLTFESQPFLVSAVPATGGWLFVNGIFSSAVQSAGASLGRAFCWTVENPYL